MKKVVKRYLTKNEAKAEGAYNIKKIEFPADPWGSKVALFEATVKVPE